MLSIVEQYPAAVIFVVTFVLSYIILKRLSAAVHHGQMYPPSVGCLPIVGSFFYLPRMNDMPEYFLQKSYKLGSVFSFRIGNMYTVVLNSHDVIHEALIKKANAFSTRPSYYSNHFINHSYTKGIIEHYYDAEFKKYHKLSLSILKRFGFGTNIMEDRIHAEVAGLVKNIKTLNGKSFEPRMFVSVAILKVISSIVLGNHSDPPDSTTMRIFELVHRQMYETIELVALDAWPALRFLPIMRRSLKNAIEIHTELLTLLNAKIDENLSPDAVENFSSCFAEDNLKNFDRVQLQYTMRDFIVAGTETSTTSVLWSLVLLANHPVIQKRLQKEIDDVVPRDRLPSLEDKSKLKYVEAAILELMRIKTLAPLGVPHATTSDTEVGGYFIPKNAMVFVNLFAVHMDVNEWKDPEVFRPERFLDSAGNIINKDLVIPFSIGKRSCIGELLGRQEVYLFFTGLLQNFDILPPEGKSRIDCKTVMTATLAPTTFEVRLVPR